MFRFFRNLPAILARVTSGGKIIKEVDGLRFLAIFPVVLQHLVERFIRETPVRETQHDAVMLFVTSRGFIGVFIFFAISGFILGLPFAAHALHGEREVKLKSYYWRRLTRLEPPYIIAMTICAISFLFMGLGGLDRVVPHYLASIFYVHNIVYSGWTFINPPVWTLEIEVQFYILAPFLSLFIFKIRSIVVRRIVFISLIAALIIMQSYYQIPYDKMLRLTILNHLHYFLLGLLMADIYLVEWRNGIRKSQIFNFLAIASFSGLILIWSWDHFLSNRIGFTVCLFVLFYSVFRATWVNRFLTLPWITAIGGMCYSIYLIHLPFIEFFIRLTKNITVTDSMTINYLFQLTLLLPVLLVASIIFYLLIEKPCMYKDWPQRLGRFLFKNPHSLRQMITGVKRDI